MTREDCTTCVNGKPNLGMIFCEIEGRIKSDTTHRCDNYKPKGE